MGHKISVNKCRESNCRDGKDEISHGPVDNPMYGRPGSLCIFHGRLDLSSVPKNGGPLGHKAHQIFDSLRCAAFGPGL